MAKTPTPKGTNLRHALRTPLNQIIGYSELLADVAQERGHRDLLPDLEKIRAAGNELLALIERVLVPGSLPGGEGAPPAPELPAAGAPQGIMDEALAASHEPGTILVVDDAEANRELLCRYLERQGHKPRSAPSGVEALREIAAQPFDVVLLDVMMPELSGYEVLQRLKSDPALLHVPVIMISALDELDSAVRCIALGAEDYLTKPINPVVLQARIGACLEKKRLHDREALLFSELQQKHQQLQSLESLRDDLTHMVVHDMRTPLSALLLGLQEVARDESLGDRQRRLLEYSLRGGHTLMGMINDLLDVSKLEDGSLQLAYEPLAPPELVQQALDQVAPIAQHRGLRLSRRIGETLPTVSGDGEKLQRTLVNLLANAIRYTPSGGSVVISVEPDREGGGLLFSVSDTGPGIPESDFDRIFQKFGQAGGRRPTRHSTGLGLTFCKMIIEAHNGRIWVESQMGQGSTFHFTLPPGAA